MLHTQKTVKLNRVALGLSLALSFFSNSGFAGDAFSPKNSAGASGAELQALNARLEQIERDLGSGGKPLGASRNKQGTSLSAGSIEAELQSVGASLLGKLNDKHLVRHDQRSFLLSEREIPSFVAHVRANKAMAESFPPPAEMSGASNPSLKIPPPPQSADLSRNKKSPEAQAAGSSAGKPKPAEVQAQKSPPKPN